MRAVKRSAALVLVAIGVASLVAGPAAAAGGSTPPAERSASIPDVVFVRFEVRGDLQLVEGRLHDSNCVLGTDPNPFRVHNEEALTVVVRTQTLCFRRGEEEAIWLLTTQPKSPRDPPETMGVRLRYGDRATQVAFLHPSRDLRWSSHVLAPDRVVVEVVGK